MATTTDQRLDIIFQEYMNMPDGYFRDDYNEVIRDYYSNDIP